MFIVAFAHRQTWKGFTQCRRFETHALHYHGSGRAVAGHFLTLPADAGLSHLSCASVLDLSLVPFANSAFVLCILAYAHSFHSSVPLRLPRLSGVTAYPLQPLVFPPASLFPFIPPAPAPCLLTPSFLFY